MKSPDKLMNGDKAFMREDKSMEIGTIWFYCLMEFLEILAKFLVGC